MEQTHIGHYILGRTIGAGGFAKVKLAKHDLTELEVAVKIINKKKMKNKNMISKVKREIKILKFINHPNIIKLYEVLDSTNDILVIMELAEKGELYDYIQNNQISEQQAKYLFSQIIQGVEYIHQNHFSHRDLKPQNILINRHNTIKIGDFGLSNLMKDGKLLKTSCGSPNYASPQIVGSRKYQGTSIDVWSCGVILYALLVGCLPFDQETVALLYKKIQQGTYNIPSNIGEAASDLIRKMLVVDPTKRIKISQIKSHCWLCQTIPIYSRFLSAPILKKQNQPDIDEEIYMKIKNMNFINWQQRSEQKVRKSIKRCDDESFVIVYELLKDEKYNQQSNDHLTNGSSTIFQKIQNQVRNKLFMTTENSPTYGKTYLMAPKALVEIILDVFNKLRVNFQIKNSDYCIKCTYQPKQTLKQTQMQDEKPKQMIQDRFSKNQISFLIQIYSKGLNKQLVDMQLIQGHPLIFFSLVKKINIEMSLRIS